MMRWIVIVALGLFVGCGKSDSKPAAQQGKGPTAPATPFPRQVATSLKKAGLRVSAFEVAAARPYDAATCAKGEVDRLDVLMCEFADAAASQKAEKKLEQFAAGAVSGGTRRAGNRVLVVADRNKTDLEGKGINRVLTAFAGQ